MLYPEMTTPEPLPSADLHPNLSNSSTQRIMVGHLHHAAHAIAVATAIAIAVATAIATSCA